MINLYSYLVENNWTTQEEMFESKACSHTSKVEKIFILAMVF